MSTTRTVLLSAALGLATLGASVPAVHAAVAPAPAPASPTSATPGDVSDHHDVLAKRRCRWNKYYGLICDVGDDTITL